MQAVPFTLSADNVVDHLDNVTVTTTTRT